METSRLRGFSEWSLPPLGSKFGTVSQGQGVPTTADMFKILVEKQKGTSDYMCYYVDEKIREIINGIVLQHGYIEASSRAWKAIQKQHGHKVVSPGPTQSESSDSGLGQSSQSLNVIRQQEYVRKLQNELEAASEHLTTMATTATSKTRETTSAFDFTQFKELWEEKSGGDGDATSLQAPPKPVWSSRTGFTNEVSPKPDDVWSTASRKSTDNTEQLYMQNEPTTRTSLPSLSSTSSAGASVEYLPTARNVHKQQVTPIG